MSVVDAPPGSGSLRRAEELCRAGSLDEAARLTRVVIDENSGDAMAYRLLAHIEHARGDRGDESAALEGLLSFEPDNALIWRRLGALAVEFGQADKACYAYRRATRLAAGEYANWHGLALAALSAQRLPLAQQAGQELLQRFPDRAGSHLIAGHIAKAVGSDVVAVAAYERALELDPTSSEAAFNLVEQKTPAPTEPLSGHLARLTDEVPLIEIDAANLGFARARIQEAAGDYAAAFKHYALANRAAAEAMHQRGIIYQPPVVESWVDATIRKYPAAAFQPSQESSAVGIRLIFIVGMPRSGTTLVEQILTSHPRIMGGGELPIATDCERLYNLRRADLGCSGPVDPADSRERELIADMREIYVDRLLERDLDGAFITDKLPGNFARLGFIRLLFPDAIIVHCRRHPIATCWSLFAANFGIHDPYYNSLEHLAHYYRSYRRLVDHWCTVLQPTPIELHYEELVTRPDEQSRRLLAAIGLEWDARCLAFHENRRAVFTASQRQVRTPIYSTALERWRRYEAHLEALQPLDSSLFRN